MTTNDLLFLTGTIGYFAFAALATFVLVQWHNEQGRSWLAGTAGLLAVGRLAAAGACLIVGAIRALAQNEQVLSVHDARVIAGAAPWVAFIYLAGQRNYRGVR